MSRYKQFQRYLKQQWRLVTVAVLAAAVPIALFTFGLASHSRGVLVEERMFIESSNTIGEVFATPVFLPYRALVYILVKFGAEHIVYYRMISVIIGLLSVWAFYAILRRWYTRRTALIGSALLCTSSVVLHAARTALPDILLLGVLVTMSVGVWLRQTRRKRLVLYAFVGALTLTVYIPGLIWVAIAFLAQRGRQFLRLLGRQTIKSKLALAALALIILAPAIVSLAYHPREALGMFGLPPQIHSVTEHSEHALSILKGLVWQYDAAPALWTPGTPLLDVISFVMILLGTYALRFQRKLLRSRIQVGLFILWLVLVLIAGPVSIVALAPALYLLATGGFAFMLQQWFTVFPRNPFARTIAIVCMLALLTSSAIYQSYRYFTVWPNHPEVRVVLTDQYLVK